MHRPNRLPFHWVESFVICYLLSVCAHLPSHQRNSHEIRARSNNLRNSGVTVPLLLRGGIVDGTKPGEPDRKGRNTDNGDHGTISQQQPLERRRLEHLPHFVSPFPLRQPCTSTAPTERPRAPRHPEARVHRGPVELRLASAFFSTRARGTQCHEHTTHIWHSIRHTHTNTNTHKAHTTKSTRQTPCQPEPGSPIEPDGCRIHKASQPSH